MCVSDPGERWPMADRSDGTNLQRKRAFPNSFEKLNGANGMSDIEGKATRGGKVADGRSIGRNQSTAETRVP